MLPLMVVKSPKCDDMVTLPAGLTPESRVRCPFTKEEFLVQEILDQLPPMLEVVDGPAAASAGAMAATLADDADQDTAGDAAFGFLDTAEKPDLVEEPDTTKEEGEAEREGAAATGSALFETEADHEPPAASTFDFAAADAAESAAAEGGTAAAPGRRAVRPRPKRKPKNATAEVIKIVLGGIAGLLIALLIMWWAMGTDPFNVAPIVGKWLPWIVPAKLRDPAAEQQQPADGGQAADDGSGQNGGGQDGGSLDGGSTQNDEPEVAESFDPNAPFDLPGSGELAPDVTDSTDHHAAGPEAADNGVGADGTLTASGNGDSSNDPPDDPPPDTTDDELLGVRSAPFYTGDDLGEALKAANEAKAAVDPKVGLELTTDEKKTAAASVYKTLCRLSERATFVDPNGSQVEDRLAAIDGILLDLGKKKSNLDVFGLFGATLVGMKDPPADKGIVLAGTVRAIAPLGKLYNTELQLFAGSQPIVTVVSKEDPQQAFGVGDRVIVLGYVVEEPSLKLAGYDGNQRLVVWGGYPVVLPEAEKKSPGQPRRGGN